jgi:predicted deacylase
MNIKRIAGHDLVPGRIIKDHIHVGGTEIHVPHVIISGRKPGPLLLVTAGIHNAEYVGIQAAIELSSEIDPEQLAGTLIIVPVANRSGFENRTMSMVHEDGKNLNRVFPGDASGTAADRLAHLLFNTFIKYADAYVDLHSGDGYEELIPYVYYVGDTVCEKQASAMASCVDTEFIVRSRCKTGGAYNIASVNGIPSVLIERGQLSMYPREEIDADKADVINIMKYLGMLDGAHETYTKTPLIEHELFSPATGCWYPEFHPGDTFFEGE